MFNDVTLSNKTFMKKEFNENVNLDIINSLYDSKAVSSNDQFEKVPEGNYIVAVTDMFVGKTKSDKDALKITFTISDGKDINKKLYYTQVLTQDFCIKKAVSLLNQMQVKDMYIVYEDLFSFSSDVKFMFEMIKDNCEFDLRYKLNNKGYPEYSITGVYDLI